jgi:hypothetical protein
MTSGAVSVIDILPIRNFSDYGHFKGLAYNAQTDQFYFTQSSYSYSNPSGLIYTIESDGTLVSKWELLDLYPNPNTGLGVEISDVVYDNSTNRFFISAAYKQTEYPWEGHLIEASTDGSTLFGDISTIDSRYFEIDGANIWGTSYYPSSLYRYTQSGQLIESYDMSTLFGAYGPSTLTSSFDNGFFINDHFGRGIVEVDQYGNGLRYFSTETLGDGRGNGIASDLSTGRLFWMTSNEIYTLDQTDLLSMETSFPEVPSSVPIPAAGWLLFSALIGFPLIKRKK